MRRHVAAAPVEHDPLAVEADAARRIGQILAHREEIDRVAAQHVQQPLRYALQVRFENGARDAAEQLDVAERRPVEAAGR